MDCKQAIKNLVDVPKKFNISGGDITGNINMPNDTYRSEERRVGKECG